MDFILMYNNLQAYSTYVNLLSTVKLFYLYL